MMSTTDPKINLYIHIGLPKTGTSAIQKSLVDNYELLKQKFSLLYPELGRWVDGSHHGLAFAFGDNPYLKTLSPDAQKDLLSLLQNEIDESSCQNVLLSSECFHLYNNEQFIEFSKGFNVRLICYLRRADMYLESFYAQNVQDSVVKESRSFDKFIEENYDKIDYLEFLKRWETLSARNNIVVRIYDKSQFIEGELLVDFYNALDIDSTEESLSVSTRVNVSFPNIVNKYKLLLNRVLENQSEYLVSLLKNYSMTNSDDYKVKGSFLTHELSCKIIQKYIGNINAISTLYTVDATIIYPKIEADNDNVYLELQSNDVYRISKYLYSFDKDIFNELLSLSDDFQETNYPEYNFKLKYLLNEVIKNEAD